jgi:hypothetical protein
MSKDIGAQCDVGKAANMAEPFTNIAGESYQPPAVDLMSYLVQGQPSAYVGNLNRTMTDRLHALYTAAPPEVRKDLSILSGARSTERQKQLWEAALKKYGSAAEARKWVAPPGKSQHESGNAVDFRYGSAAAKKWVHENAAKYGLHFRMANEPWHIEPIPNWKGKVPPIPPMNIPGPAPIPASSAGLEALRARYASLGAPMPMPRPADRIPATPSIAPGTKMTDAQVAELYKGILPPSRPAVPLPIDPRLSRPPGSLPAASPRPNFGIADSVRSPALFQQPDGRQLVGIPDALDNRFWDERRVDRRSPSLAGGFGSLLGKPVSLTAPNPAPTPSFASQFASKLASVPSTANKTVAPGAGVSQGLLQAMRAVPTAPPPPASSPSFANQFASKLAAVPPPAPKPASGPSFADAFGSKIAAVPPPKVAPIPATRPAVTAPIPMPLPASRMPPIPAGHDQMLLARTGVGAGITPPIPATMSAALAAQRMAQPSAAPMGLSFADKFSNAVAVGAMMNGGKAAPGIGGGSALSFAPKAPSSAQLFLSNGYIYQQTPTGYVKVGKAGDIPIPATQSPALLAQRQATPSFNPASSGSMWTSQSDYHQSLGLGQHSTIGR